MLCAPHGFAAREALGAPVEDDKLVVHWLPSGSAVLPALVLAQIFDSSLEQIDIRSCCCVPRAKGSSVIRVIADFNNGTLNGWRKGGRLVDACALDTCGNRRLRLGSRVRGFAAARTTFKRALLSLLNVAANWHAKPYSRRTQSVRCAQARPAARMSYRWPVQGRTYAGTSAG